ncbi:MAG: double-strand break repair helicase AddA [Pseudomonadota bacterium]
MTGSASAVDAISQASERQRLASDPGASVWVGASAGTGKTKVLTDRVLRLMLVGTPPGRILCLTFTKAAAANMAERISAVLAGWATMGQAALVEALTELTAETPGQADLAAARRLFARVLDTPGGMAITTIHGFCQSLLRRFPIEARLPPHFDLIDERDALEIQQTVRQRLFENPMPELVAPLGLVTGLVDADTFDGLMDSMLANRQKLQLATRQPEGLSAAIIRRLNMDEADSAERLLAAGCLDRAFDGPGLRNCAEALADGSDPERQRASAIFDWLNAPADVRVSMIDAYRRVFLTDAGTVRARLMNKATLERCPGGADILAAEAARLVALDNRLRALAIAKASMAIFAIGSALIEAYEKAKQQRGVMDYTDLILRAAALLRSPDKGAWVLYKLDGGIDHILVDEAQDTSPEQWQIVTALAEEFFAGKGRSEVQRTIFAVGDEKQSIFGFQGADPAAFDVTRKRFQDQIQAAEQTWRSVPLQISFRSARAVLDAVDEIFAPEEVRKGVAVEPLAHGAAREGVGGRVELWPPVGPVDDDDEGDWSPPVHQRRHVAPAARLASAIADRVKRLIDDGDRLVSADRPVRAGDFLILARRRSDVFYEIVRALKDRGLPVAGVDRMILTEQLAVMDLLALIDFLLLPDDDLTLATVLKSPLIDLAEDDLFRLAHGRKGPLWQALAARAGDPVYRPAFDYLSYWLARADYVGPHALVADLLVQACPGDRSEGPSKRGSGRRALIHRLGEDAKDAIDELLVQALAFERHHPSSLQRFVHWLRQADMELKRELETGAADQVRIMTVHGAKGLQAPIVVLADTMSRPAGGTSLFWPGLSDDGPPLWRPHVQLREPVTQALEDGLKQREAEEYRRLLYVALTRAEDRLIITGHHGSRMPKEQWYDLCREGMNRLNGVEPASFDADWADTMLVYEQPQTVEPRRGEHGILEQEPVELPAWADQPPPPEPQPTRPLIPSRPSADEPAVRSPLADEEGERFKRGLLIHQLLQMLPDLPSNERASAAARFLERPVHALDRDQQMSYASEALAVIDHPQFAPLFGPDSRAEVPVTARIGQTVLSGQIDRLLVADADVTILDYKTNRPPPRMPGDVDQVYLQQMAAYRAALRAIYPDRPIACVLGWTDGPILMPLPDDLLDRHAPDAEPAP